jgi:hypothetical protein
MPTSPMRVGRRPLRELVTPYAVRLESLTYDEREET